MTLLLQFLCAFGVVVGVAMWVRSDRQIVRLRLARQILEQSYRVGYAPAEMFMSAVVSRINANPNAPDFEGLREQIDAVCDEMIAKHKARITESRA